LEDEFQRLFKLFDEKAPVKHPAFQARACEVCSERTHNTKREAEKKTQINIPGLDKFKSA
jgi:hypothetical protein